MRTVHLLLVILLLLVGVELGNAHDASTYGGLFRSRNTGESWLPVNTGQLIGSVLDLAVHPRDKNHLLLAMDSGLLRSRDGGENWQRETAAALSGTVLAVAFSADGSTVWAATADVVLRQEGAREWQRTLTPADALPVRALRASRTVQRAYLVALDGFFVSDDEGRSWSHAGKGLPQGEIAAFAQRMNGADEALFLIVNATLWASSDSGRNWRVLGKGLPRANVEAIFAHPRQAQRLHALARGQLHVSHDFGSTWHPQGKPLPHTQLVVRGLGTSSDGNIVMVTTHRGLFRSTDGGATWALHEGGLPPHLEAGPLAIDPHDANTFYAGYAPTPYGEIWRCAAEARARRAETGAGGWLLWVSVAALLGLATLSLREVYRRR